MLDEAVAKRIAKTREKDLIKKHITGRLED